MTNTSAIELTVDSFRIGLRYKAICASAVECFHHPYRGVRRITPDR